MSRSALNLALMAAVLFLTCGAAGAQTSSAVHVGSILKAPQKTKDVKPVYPPMAVASHVQGIVILEATIGADGKVEDAKVIRSIPLLDQAALDAVRQWEFTPTLLNGVPVPVVMALTVNFSLPSGSNSQRTSEALPPHSVPQTSPCADQPKTLTELTDAFNRGSVPSSSETTGSWVAIGIILGDYDTYLNCAGLKRGNKFEEVMLAKGDSVEMHVVGASDQTRTLAPDHAGSVTFPFDAGGDAGPVYRCRITTRNTLACLIDVYRQGVEFKKMSVNEDDIYSR
jgi:TonB family protein